MNLRGPLRGKGEVGRVSGFSLMPTRVKSGRVFAPQLKKGISKSVEAGKLACKWERKGKGGLVTKKGLQRGLSKYITLIKDCV
jgi:hypothetical protein